MTPGTNLLTPNGTTTLSMLEKSSMLKGAITRSRFKECSFQVAEDKVRQIQKSQNKFELSRFLPPVGKQTCNDNFTMGRGKLWLAFDK